MVVYFYKLAIFCKPFGKQNTTDKWKSTTKSFTGTSFCNFQSDDWYKLFKHPASTNISDSTVLNAYIRQWLMCTSHLHGEMIEILGNKWDNQIVRKTLLCSSRKYAYLPHRRDFF